MHQNGLLLVAGNKVETRKLRTCQNMAWKGFCSFVIYANLHNLPCICVKMAPTGTFFHFLVIVGFEGENRTLSTWQSIVWKAFLLFGDFCYSSQFAVYMHHNGSGGYFFTFLLVVGNTVQKRKLRTWHNMIWKAFLLFGNYANLHLLPCICIKMAPTGTFFTLLLVAGNKVETRKLRTCQSLEGFVWWFMLIFTICRVYASKWLRRVLFFTFLWFWYLRWKKEA